ncbi:bifunctional 3-oxoadipate enol-lactonase/4-carboxymuconolactone decarboxylase PcaDC [Aureimonas altamirensis]|uniref:bifunctional 3-oxoadipate enol-lactonase/4-carboxymuconolactone decarboxylase PcaDC n=1 Tax=Aureimonas altamirensis TaxID=370622 RepID=UPI003335A5A6
MQFAQVGDLTLHCEFRPGPGPALVFINSLGTDFRIWDGVVAALGAGQALLRYDKRGHGLTGDGIGPGSIDAHVRDLAGLMEHHAVTGAVVVGLSVGGMIAQGLALARPDLVSALVLSNTAHRIGTPQSWSERIDAVRAGGLEAIADGVMEKWFTAGFRQAGNPPYRLCRTMFERCSPAGYIATCEAIAAADFTERAPAITVPALCIAGSDDGSTPPQLVHALASLIPGARTTVIDNAGHLPNVERPQAYADTLRGFLAELAPEAGAFEAGMATRRQVLGDAHVDRASAAITDFDRAFQTFITEGAWGTVWTGAQLTRRERSLVTIALLAALGHGEEVAMHVRATRNTGASEADIAEALMHVAVYAGVPAANSAFRIAKATIGEMRKEPTA